ncbi:MAG: glycosyltransferase family 4 protein [Prevotella sp.]|nr:glycosyltransferase family 4 protein [Prevotella sp.]
MKVFYVYTALLTKGGADRVLTEKANWLAEHGYEVGIITDTQMGRPPVFPLSTMVKLINLDIDFSKEYGHNLLMRTYLYYQLMSEYKRKMKAVLDAEKPDIVITTMGRDLDFLTDIYKDGAIIGEAHTTKHFIRNFHLLEQRGFPYKQIAWYWRRKMDRNAQKLKGIVLLTKEDAESWQGTTRTYVIPNALPFEPNEASNLQNKQAIAVGRYNNAKGYEYLVEAWQIVHRKHPDWTIHIYGSGEMKEQVKSLIEGNNLQNTMLMHEPTDNIREKYLESSICVVSSRYEGFSMVILESMVCGVPVVSFDCPHGPRNIIHNGEDGILVEYLNTQAMADSICELIEHPGQRIELGKKAQNNIQRFSKDRVMKLWTEFFSELRNQNTHSTEKPYN